MRSVMQYLMVALAATLLLAPSALAGQREGAFTLSPMVGYHVFEGDQRTDDSVSYGLAVGYNLTKNWAFELDARYTPTETDFEAGANNFDVDVWTGSLNALYHFNPDGSFVPYVVAGFGGMVFDGGDTGVGDGADDGDDDSDFMLNAGAGVKYFFTDNVALRLDARYIADLHSDRNFDQDPGSDNVDHNLIATAGLVWQFGGPPPAPAPPVDSDMDGVPDARDKCPGTPLGTAVDAVGCPPAPPKPAPVVEKPAPAPPPPPAPVVVPPAPIAKEIITLNLLFDFDSAKIKDDMIPVLEQAKKILDEDPAATFMVMGHTCNIGTDAYNQKLSERRATSVKAWLVSNGIATSRLEDIGYGEAKPKYDNKTKEGRKLNRRVEIQTR
ncbi:MAG: OmpA family protein [Desulfuromonadales bacterium]|nr:OmpA family protein [Desulfuromonadales bacterium]